MSYLPLRDYGLVGNQSSAVLISKLGSIDWCCLPYFDSPSHFGTLLDENQGGFLQIVPDGEYHSDQGYIENTNVLETRFETPTGRGIVTDWMPVHHQGQREPVIFRQVRVTEGHVKWLLTCAPRFAYGSELGQAERSRNGVLFRGAQPGDLALLQGEIPFEIEGAEKSISTRFTLNAGERKRFAWRWGRQSPDQELEDPEPAIRYWQDHAHKCAPTGCVFAGPWHDMVTRSSLAVELMSTSFSGSITESVTTSIPSLTGGSRNWDYRYAWVRNSAFAVQALMHLGFPEEADGFFSWLSDVVVRDGAEALQSVYTLDGGRYLPERELTHLSGYAGSRPVRVGNLSARQFQLDIFGHVMLTAAQQFQMHGRLPDGLWPKLTEIAEYICQAWRRPDRGPWENRSRPEHFVVSKVMCWVVLDRACRLSDSMGYPTPHRWSQERDILHRTICNQGYDDSRAAFVRAFGQKDLDASALLIPLMGFLPFDDYRIQTTLDAIQSELSDGVLIHRYRTTEGHPESDGGHLLSSFLFISCLALAGRVDEAGDRLAELCTYATPMGLFGENVDPSSGDPAGNFPSSSAHLALVNASLYVGIARGRKASGFPVIGASSWHSPSPLHRHRGPRAA